MQLQGGIDHLLGRFGGVKLGHRRLAGDARRPHVLSPGGAVNQKRGRIHLQRHVGNVALDHLQTGKGLVLDPAAFYARQGLVQGAPRHAKRRRADGRAEHVEHGHGQLEPLACLADKGAVGQEHAVQVQPGQRMGRDDLDPLGDGQAGAVRRHQEGR